MSTGISITTGANGVGSGSVKYAVAPNVKQLRGAHWNAHHRGQTFTINQAAAPVCTC